MNRVEKLAFGLALAGTAGPALAGVGQPLPAPVAGVGIGAVLLVGLGYRTLKGRIRR